MYVFRKTGESVNLVTYIQVGNLISKVRLIEDNTVLGRRHTLYKAIYFQDSEVFYMPLTYHNNLKFRI